MSATKKDFEAIAQALKAVPLEGCVRQRIATILADVFQDLNARFDRARFYRASGLPEHCVHDHTAWVSNPSDLDPALFG